ncbi:hypothetical protein TRFO_06912 [Tritrichomonas foetus]|uniref:Integral membrane protein n=1 Tax=Tritrichomonas foetus TaxID=1144522 RepID=A0A1J4JZB1_9EUKA|nr:hypothetical protein TRFO_06912 [Tritrichomonas foetus]|eukprot:OHT02868.1 hypothetical protein TRFO_06912 [Tritrichomonas foetus]
MTSMKNPIDVKESISPKVEENYSKWGKVWPVLFFLLLGIGHAILQKLAFILEADGLPKYGYHKFRKPWFITTLTFLGMACATPVYAIVQFIEAKNGHIWPTIQSLSFKEYAEFAIPAFSDAFENIISAVCIAFVGVSIDSMMKSGTLIGVSLISRFFFKILYPKYKWWSIAVVFFALIMVGAAGIINSKSSSTITTGPLWTGVIIVLKLVSQLGYSVRISYEEYFTQIKGYHPVMICGLEGTWTFIMTGLVFMPMVQFLPSEEGNGIHEDSFDSFLMMGNNHVIIITVVLLWACGLSYNCVSTVLIGRTSAIIHTLVEAFRTFLIWMIQFMMFYSFRTNENLYQYRLLGEEWEMGSYIQLAGFIIMNIGILAYNGVPHYPCFRYKTDEERAEEAKVKLEGGNLDDIDKVKKPDLDETHENTETTDITAEAIDNHSDNSDSDNVSVRSMSIDSSYGTESDDPEDPR